MIKVFTQNDLIKFLYHETSEEESREISNALKCDSELQGLLDELKVTIAQLDNTHLEPASSTILSILNYSRSVQAKA